MRFFLAAGRLAALAMLASPSLAAAHDVTAGSLVIQDPWIRATPGGAAVAGGYLTIVNKGSIAERLTGGSLEASQSFALHRMSTDGGVMTMRPAGPLDIPPGGAVVLAPSGLHIMFAGLKHGLKRGQEVAGTLVFDHAGTVPVVFSVAGIGARGPEGKDTSHGGASMPGMDMD